MLLTGIIGYPLERTFSPCMHNGAFKALGINGVYVPLSVTSNDLVPALKGLRALGFRGVNVTAPHKQRVCELLTDLHEEAAEIRSVNTIIADHTRLTGYNTDIFGFRESLRNLHIAVAGSVLLIGAGGAARACAHVVQASGGAELLVANRNRERGRQCASHFQSGFVALESIGKVIPRSDLVINATSVNMQRCVLPLMKKGAVYYDINYQYRLFQAKNVKVFNGLLMLAWQGAKAFSLWTGQAMPIEIMKQKVGLA